MSAAREIYRVPCRGVNMFHVLDARWREPLEDIGTLAVRQAAADAIEKVEGYDPYHAFAEAISNVNDFQSLVRRLAGLTPTDRYWPFNGARLGSDNRDDALRGAVIAHRLLSEASARMAAELPKHITPRLRVA